MLHTCCKLSPFTSHLAYYSLPFHTFLKTICQCLAPRRRGGGGGGGGGRRGNRPGEECTYMIEVVNIARGEGGGGGGTNVPLCPPPPQINPCLVRS